jgi:hypothetical protein
MERKGEYASNLVIAEEMKPDPVWGPSGTIRHLSYSTKEFFVSIPSKPLWPPGLQARLRISLEVEHISATRPLARITLTSNPIPWTPRLNAEAGKKNLTHGVALADREHIRVVDEAAIDDVPAGEGIVQEVC